MDTEELTDNSKSKQISANAQKNWHELIKPDRLEIKAGLVAERQATIVAEPLERGFGLTIGNALRRVLLSSLQGSAVTSMQIDGVLHEFSSIAGVREDVSDIVLNIKGLAIIMHSAGPKKAYLKVKGPLEVTADMIDCGSDVEIINKEHIICTLGEGASISAEFTLNTGKGYVSASQNRPDDAPISLIPIDSIFSPVRSVSYRVENTRVGQRTDYDKLFMTIETNGSITPEDAMALAARILQDQLHIFINFDEPDVRVVESETAELPFNQNLLRKVEELELSVRSANCLKNDNIVYIGDLVCKSESDMLKTANFGRKSLNEIKEVLSQMGLNLGMDVPEWPIENIEELAKNLEETF